MAVKKFAVLNIRTGLYVGLFGAKETKKPLRLMEENEAQKLAYVEGKELAIVHYLRAYCPQRYAVQGVGPKKPRWAGTNRHGDFGFMNKKGSIIPKEELTAAMIYTKEEAEAVAHKHPNRSPYICELEYEYLVKLEVA